MLVLLILEQNSASIGSVFELVIALPRELESNAISNR